MKFLSAERPDLFAAVVDGVGWSNPLRYVAEQNGYQEEPEWGAINEPAGYKALKSIDSYQARVDYDAGHGIGSTRSQQDREAADTYAFLLWQLKGAS